MRRVMLIIILLSFVFCAYVAFQYVSFDVPEVHFNDDSPIGYQMHIRYTLEKIALVLAPAALSILCLLRLVEPSRHEQ